MIKFNDLFFKLYIVLALCIIPIDLVIAYDNGSTFKTAFLVEIILLLSIIILWCISYISKNERILVLGIAISNVIEIVLFLFVAIHQSLIIGVLELGIVVAVAILFIGFAGVCVGKAKGNVKSSATVGAVSGTSGVTLGIVVITHFLVKNGLNDISNYEVSIICLSVAGLFSLLFAYFGGRTWAIYQSNKKG